MHSYLSQVFSYIVQPMISSLEDIMSEFNFVSEPEIFSNDLRFKMFDTHTDNRYMSKTPLK